MRRFRYWMVNRLYRLIDLIEPEYEMVPLNVGRHPDGRMMVLNDSETAMFQQHAPNSGFIFTKE